MKSLLGVEKDRSYETAFTGAIVRHLNHIFSSGEAATLLSLLCFC